jgi:hypothetical protein
MRWRRLLLGVTRAGLPLLLLAGLIGLLLLAKPALLTGGARAGPSPFDRLRRLLPW